MEPGGGGRKRGSGGNLPDEHHQKIIECVDCQRNESLLGPIWLRVVCHARWCAGKARVTKREHSLLHQCPPPLLLIAHRMWPCVWTFCGLSAKLENIKLFLNACTANRTGIVHAEIGFGEVYLVSPWIGATCDYEFKVHWRIERQNIGVPTYESC